MSQGTLHLRRSQWRLARTLLGRHCPKLWFLIAFDRQQLSAGGLAIQLQFYVVSHEFPKVVASAQPSNHMRGGVSQFEARQHNLIWRVNGGNKAHDSDVA